MIWNVLNELTGRRNERSKSVKLCVNGRVVTDPLEIASEFNLYFSTVGSVLAERLPPAGPLCFL